MKKHKRHKNEHVRNLFSKLAQQFSTWRMPEETRVTAAERITYLQAHVNGNSRTHTHIKHRENKQTERAQTNVNISEDGSLSKQ